MMRVRKSIRLPLCAMQLCLQSIQMSQSEDRSIMKPLMLFRSRNKTGRFPGRNRGSELLKRCPKSEWIRGEKRIPGKPFTERGKIPRLERSILNSTSMIFTSHIRKTKMPGIRMLKSTRFLKKTPSVSISVSECDMVVWSCSLMVSQVSLVFAGKNYTG